MSEEIPTEAEASHRKPIVGRVLIGVLTPLAILCVVLGVYPTPVLKSLEAPVAMTIASAQEASSRRQDTLTQRDDADVTLVQVEETTR